MFADAIVHRSHRFAFAENFGSHALTNLTLGTAIGDERLHRPGKHIDETRRDGEPVRVDHIVGGSVVEIADARDPIAADSDISHASFFAGAIVNRAVFDDDVER